MPRQTVNAAAHKPFAEPALRRPVALPLVPNITATMTDAIINDDGDGKADPTNGVPATTEKIQYSVTITNSGTDATNVTYTNTIDGNTTLVPGSIKASPNALDDSYAVGTNGTLNVGAPGVLANDFGIPSPGVSAVNGSGANVGVAISVGGGTLTLNANGSFTYNAPAATGPVTFTYTAANPTGSNTATVTINVQTATNAVMDGPAPNSGPGDAYHTAADTLLDSSSAPYSVLDNDTGAAIAVVTFGPTTGAETVAGSGGTTAQGGALTVNTNGQFAYTPPSGYVGYDTFFYTIQNGLGSDTAIVTIAVGVRPTANNDSYDVIISGALNIAASGVVTNDTGSPTLTVTQVQGSGGNVGVATPATGGGTVTLNANGSFTFNAPAVTGPVTFTYQAANALSASNNATVTINVQSAPSANPDGPAAGSVPGNPYHTAVNTSISGPTAYTVLTNDTGATPLSVVSYGVNGNEAVPTNAAATLQGGSITLNAAGNLVNYTPPNATFVGSDNFKYTMTSSVGGSATASVTIKVGIASTANADAYNVHGNIGISITTSNDPMNNDTGDQIVIQSYCAGILVGNNCTTANGGTFNMASNGAFTYNPPVGYTGTDTVNYVISNGLGTSNANITFTVSNMIWFINNSGGTGDGRWGSPFNSVNAFTTVNDDVGTHPSPGDRIYIFTGSGPYNTTLGLSLLNNQIAIGAGSDLATIVGALPLGSPTLPGAGTKPNIRTTVATFGIWVGTGNTIRGLDVGVAGNETQRGIAQTGASFGTLTVTDNVTVNANAGAAVNLNTGTLNATFGSLTSANSTGSGDGIIVQSASGSFTVTGTTSITNAALAGSGVTLVSNTGTFTFAAVNVNNTGTNARGLNFSGNTGTITITSGTINSGTNRAVNIDGGTGTTPLAITLTAVTSSGGTTPGISMNKTSGSFTVTGTGAANSGGTISGKTGNVDGVLLTNVVNISLSWMLIQTNTHAGIKGTTVNGFQLTNCTVQNNGDTSSTEESGLVLFNVSGSALAGSNPTRILNTTITGNAFNNVYIQNSQVTATEFRIENSTITNNSVALGSDGVFAEATSGGGFDGTLNVNVVNSNISGNLGDGVQANCLSNGNIDLTVTNSTLSGNNIATNLTASGTCDLTFDILNNSGGTDGLLLSKNHGINLSTFNSSTAVGTLSNNTINGNGATNTGLGIRVQADAASTITTLISGNTISNTAFSGIDVSSTSTATGTISANILTNNVSAPLIPVSGGDNGIHIGAFATSPTLCVDVFGNTANGSVGHVGVLMRQFSGTTMRLERLGASQGPAGDGIVETLLNTNNTVAPGANVLIQTQIIAVANGFCSTPVQAVGGSQFVVNGNGPQVSVEQVNSLRQTALDYWRNAGATPVQLSRMERAVLSVTDLPGSYLASTDLATIYVDATAAGHGWFVDTTPFDNSEFDSRISNTELYASMMSAAFDRMDLLTALMHEMGHVAGIRGVGGHASLMAEELNKGVRYFPLAIETQKPNSDLVESGAATDQKADDSILQNKRWVSKTRFAHAQKTAQPITNMLTPQTIARARSERGEIKSHHAISKSKSQKAETQRNHAVAPRTLVAPMSGETVGPINIGTLASGESVTITYEVTVNNPPNLSLLNPARVPNQGSVSYSESGTPVLTDDPAVGGANDATETLVDLFDTTNTLVSDLNPTNTGAQVTFTATLTETPVQGSVDPTGTVDFIDTSNANAVICNDVALTSGSGQCQTSSLTAGTHNIRADYSGDGNFDPLQSNVVAQVVNVQQDISVRDAKVAEPTSGSTNMLFTVILSAPASSTVTVNFTTADEAAGPGKAIAGQDYTTSSGTVTFLTGERLKTIAVPVLSDATPGEPNETFLVNLSTPSAGSTIVDGQAIGTITALNAAGTFVISEIRTTGPGGSGDDFVEVYNNSNSPLTIAASDASAGYGLFKMGADCNATPVLIGVIPNGTVIPARGHYLFVGSAYSLANYGGTGAAAGNLTLSSDIETDANVGIFNTADVGNLSSVNRLDAVGFAANIIGNCSLLSEGTVQPATNSSALDGSYQRDQCGKLANSVVFGNCPTGGLPKDSNNNAADFFWADTAATNTTAGQHLGAPGPENLASPLLRLAGLTAILVDATKAATLAPNRERDFVVVPNGGLGTLTIRRRYRNDTGAAVTRLRFRVVDISTAPTSGGVADIRALTSSDVVLTSNDSQTCTAFGLGAPPCSVTVKGTTVETPPAQLNGGGNNTTLTVTLGTPLAAGASVNIQWRLGVQTSGSFKFFINVEALP